MKRINFLIIICLFISLVFVSSCTKEYTSKNYKKYLDNVYKAVNSENVKYLAVDVRNKEEYETLHIRQFQNYNYELGSVTEFVNWIKSNSDKKTNIYLYGNEEFILDTIEVLKKDKYNITYLTIDFNDIKEYASTLFIMDTGEYDCGC